MKYIKILPVWLCVLCLTGCCETENEIGATTETNSEGETEGTALQEAYANESKYEEIIQINEEEKISCDDSGSSADHGSSGSFGVCAPEKPGNPRGQSVKEVV